MTNTTLIIVGMITTLLVSRSKKKKKNSNKESLEINAFIEYGNKSPFWKIHVNIRFVHAEMM